MKMLSLGFTLALSLIGLIDSAHAESTACQKQVGDQLLTWNCPTVFNRCSKDYAYLCSSDAHARVWNANGAAQWKNMCKTRSSVDAAASNGNYRYSHIKAICDDYENVFSSAGADRLPTLLAAWPFAYDVDNDSVYLGDNCPYKKNPYQEDRNKNGVGDTCEDTDRDGLNDATDNCPFAPNADQADDDGDLVGNACDTGDYPTPTEAPKPVAQCQEQRDGQYFTWFCYENFGHCTSSPFVCANDDHVDNLRWREGNYDGACKSIEHTRYNNYSYIKNICDFFPTSDDGGNGGAFAGAQLDVDRDGIRDNQDNCGYTVNPFQRDEDHNGLGDVCDTWTLIGKLESGLNLTDLAETLNRCEVQQGDHAYYWYCPQAFSLCTAFPYICINQHHIDSEGWKHGDYSGACKTSYHRTYNDYGFISNICEDAANTAYGTTEKTMLTLASSPNGTSALGCGALNGAMNSLNAGLAGLFALSLLNLIRRKGA